jgi:hypothetical protein
VEDSLSRSYRALTFVSRLSQAPLVRWADDRSLNSFEGFGVKRTRAAADYRSRMKRSLVLLVAVVTASGVGATAYGMSAGGGSSPAAVLRAEATYLNARNWHPYYGLMGPRFRAQCNYATFVQRNEAVRNQITRASIAKVSTRMAGSRAYLSYETIAPPVKPFYTKNDLFVKIGGRWYDEYDAVTTCG